MLAGCYNQTHFSHMRNCENPVNAKGTTKCCKDRIIAPYSKHPPQWYDAILVPHRPCAKPLFPKGEKKRERRKEKTRR